MCQVLCSEEVYLTTFVITRSRRKYFSFIVFNNYKIIIYGIWELQKIGQKNLMTQAQNNDTDPADVFLYKNVQSKIYNV